jgi:hypothetical protein
MLEGDIEPQLPFLLPSGNCLRLSEVQRLGEILRKYDRQEFTRVVGGMLTVPEFQANCFRLELLLQVGVSRCAGTAKFGPHDLQQWLNRHLGVHDIAGMTSSRPAS